MPVKMERKHFKSWNGVDIKTQCVTTVVNGLNSTRPIGENTFNGMIHRSMCRPQDHFRQG